MGSFANSMFSVMLSWVRAAVDWLWTFCTSEENGGFLPWIGENWLSLTIALCAVCLAVDFVVHMLRWQPYKVWASFFRRLFSPRQRDEEEDFDLPTRRQMSRVVQREWYYADGTARREEVEEPVDEQDDASWYSREEAPARVSSADMSQQYVMQFARPEEQPLVPPAHLKYQQELDKVQPLEGLEDYPQPVLVVPELPSAEDEPEEEPVTQTERIRKRMARLNLQNFLHNDEDELNLRYKPAPPAMDKREAYGKPYYPPQWQRPGDVGTSVNRED